MRMACAALVLTFAAAAAGAQQEPPATSTAPPPVDYSREKLTRIFSNIIEPPPKVEPRVKWGLGYVEFKALNMRWRIAVLPFLAPLPGSVRRTSPTIFDPFEMTGTVIPYTPRTWNDKRNLSKELRRIERTERERAKVVAKPTKVISD